MFDFIVTAAKGLDALLRIEILDILDIAEDEKEKFGKVQPGQVSFSGSLADAYKICLCSRLANRVLVVLTNGRVSNADELYSLASNVDWPAQFDTKFSFRVQFIGVNKAINNSQFGALKVKDAIVDSFVEDGQARPNVERQNPDIQVHVRLRRETAFICLDLSGTSLHQRGYREATGDAPLKEQLAAAMLYRSGWANNTSQALLDPMCGSGTIAIEAALMAAHIAPNIKREVWGFDHWFGHNEGVFEAVRTSIALAKSEQNITIYAYDISTKLIDMAKLNAANAGVEDLIEFKQCDVLQCTVSHDTGYVVSNPPYGERLDDYVGLLPLYAKLGIHLKQQFANWHVALLCSNKQLLQALKLRTHKRYTLFNGKLETQLALYQIANENLQSYSPAPDEDEFSNRLRKNIKRLKSWLKRTNTNAYRVYDADLPNYNFAIDIYADWVVVQEYAPPKQIPQAVAQERLAQALLHIPHILNIERNKIVLKVRKKQTGKQQYEKVDEQRVRVKAYENNAQFWINPNDYLDVGLFLDHRLTRARFAQECNNKHVLNLFCYTASVSVMAAMHGAKSVTSVDMSKTYIQWAKDNFTLNKLSGNYEFIQQDCLSWLNTPLTSQGYDLMFIDPPSFSNSKRMDKVFDVQQDHLALLTQAYVRLNEKGKVYFSNNLRGFRLNQDALIQLGYSIKDISKQTIDEDFKRNPKIHQCWILSK